MAVKSLSWPSRFFTWKFRDDMYFFFILLLLNHKWFHELFFRVYRVRVDKSYNSSTVYSTEVVWSIYTHPVHIFTFGEELLFPFFWKRIYKSWFHAKKIISNQFDGNPHNIFLFNLSVHTYFIFNDLTENNLFVVSYWILLNLR